MSDIEIVRDEIRAARPDAVAKLDPPENPANPWFLDFFLSGGYDVTVEWWPGRGFGVTSDDEHGFGEGADEFYPDVKEVVGRVLFLLRTRGRTVSPEPVRLAEMRKEAGISQQDVAERMGLHQSSVSRVETGTDPLLSTLRNYAKALGGELIVEVAVPGRPRQPIRFDCARTPPQPETLPCPAT